MALHLGLGTNGRYLRHWQNCKGHEVLEALILILAAGPVSKWDDDAPDLAYLSNASLFDVERCLIDLPNATAPFVYRQPDRPDEVRILWSAPSGITAARVDLRRTDAGVNVTSWKFKGDRVEACAPPK